MLDLDGVPAFDQAVYAVARTIPAGETLTYGEIATRIGEPGAAQAVGQALGRNPCPIVVPCHRVLAAGGKLGGFSARGGVTTKLAAAGHRERAALTCSDGGGSPSGRSGPSGADQVVDRRDDDADPRAGGVHHHAAADVDADVVDGAAHEHEVTRLQLVDRHVGQGRELLAALVRAGPRRPGPTPTS